MVKRALQHWMEEADGQDAPDRSNLQVNGHLCMRSLDDRAFCSCNIAQSSQEPRTVSLFAADCTAAAVVVRMHTAAGQSEVQSAQSQTPPQQARDA